MKNKLIALICLQIVILATLVLIPPRTIVYEAYNKPQSVLASWYGFESCVNPDCLMANGEVFNENEISCASRTHYGKILEISYKGKTILCPVSDKISKTYDSTRVDLSKRAFETLADLDRGIIEIVIK